MAYEYRLIPDHSLLVIRGSGTVTSEDINRNALEIQEDPAWRPMKSVLVDWRRIDEMLIEIEDIQQLSKDLRAPEAPAIETGFKSRTAVVLSDHDYDFVPGLYTSYLRSLGLETEIFYQLKAALEWLGVDAGALPK